MGYWDMGYLRKGAKSLMNPEDAYKKAANQYQKYWDEAQRFQNAYNRAGTDQIPILTGAQNQLLNPQDLLGKWMESYKTSPYAKQSMDNATASGLDAASSMGLEGSSSALHNIQQSSSDIMNQDRQGFLKDLMDKFKSGINIGTDIYGRGATTAGNLGNQALNVGNNMGEMAFGAQAAPGELMKSIISMMMKMYGGGAGGGAGAGASAA